MNGAAPEPTPTFVVPQAQPSPTSVPRPIGVTILAILYILAALPLTFVAFFVMIGAAAATFVTGALPAWLHGIIAAAGLLIGLLLLVIAVLVVFIGLGNLRGRPWAWTLTVVLTILALVVAVLGLIGSVTGQGRAPGGAVLDVLVNGLVLWYFYTPDVKRFFGKAAHRALWQRG